MPRALVNAVRLKRYGEPWAGGWMVWPVKWVIEMETAEDAYTALTETNRAMSKLDGDALDEWRANHSHYVNRALEIETLLADETDHG